MPLGLPPCVPRLKVPKGPTSWSTALPAPMPAAPRNTGAVPPLVAAGVVSNVGIAVATECAARGEEELLGSVKMLPCGTATPPPGLLLAKRAKLLGVAANVSLWEAARADAPAGLRGLPVTVSKPSLPAMRANMPPLAPAPGLPARCSSSRDTRSRLLRGWAAVEGDPLSREPLPCSCAAPGLLLVGAENTLGMNSGVALAALSPVVRTLSGAVG